MRTRIIALVLCAAAASGCGAAAVPPAPYAIVVSGGLPPRPPTPPPGAAGNVVAFAQAQVGRPYCWGGTGPGCFDCSGLAMTAWRQAGVRLPRTADAIAQALPEVPLKAVRPGDILWWPGHVAIYAGDGWSVEALNARSGVVMRRPPPPRRAFRPTATL